MNSFAGLSNISTFISFHNNISLLLTLFSLIIKIMEALIKCVCGISRKFCARMRRKISSQLALADLINPSL